MDDPELTDFALGLETQVWRALLAGDPDADRALLSDDFLGVYPTGFSDREEHATQLADGPTVVDYEIRSPQAVEIAPGVIQFAYDAHYRRKSDAPMERMYIMSIWAEREGQWVNTFSQDTPAAE